MIDEIIAGISLALNAEFGDDVKIYPEQQKQGFEGPCFLYFPSSLPMICFWVSVISGGIRSLCITSRHPIWNRNKNAMV